MRLCCAVPMVTSLLAAPALAPLSAQARTVVLVRHAEKASATADPDLSEAGMARAESLRVALADFPLDAIFVSQFKRTRETAAPAARAAHLTPRVVPAPASVEAYADSMLGELDRLPAGSTALVVGHSNTIGPLITALGGPHIPDLCDGEYATIFVLERPGGGRPARLIRASYGDQTPAAKAGCTTMR